MAKIKLRLHSTPYAKHNTRLKDGQPVPDQQHTNKYIYKILNNANYFGPRLQTQNNMHTIVHLVANWENTLCSNKSPMY